MSRTFTVFPTVANNTRTCVAIFTRQETYSIILTWVAGTSTNFCCKNSTRLLKTESFNRKLVLTLWNQTFAARPCVFTGTNASVATGAKWNTRTTMVTWVIGAGCHGSYLEMNNSNTVQLYIILIMGKLTLILQSFFNWLVPYINIWITFKIDWVRLVSKKVGLSKTA